MPKFVIDCKTDKELEMLRELLGCSVYTLYTHMDSKRDFWDKLKFDHMELNEFLSRLSSNMENYEGTKNN